MNLKIQKATCVFCYVKDETEVTLALSTKDDVTAHQNCLLYSAGIYCQNSPEYDDLFGFSVEDVKKEVKRGSKLRCSKCKRRGATAGCENGRCKKSYHYPCAIEDGAHPVEDVVQGKFSLYCHQHWQQRTEKNDSALDERPSTSTATGPSKQFCVSCMSIEGHIQVKSMSDTISWPYCDEHAPPSRKRSGSGNSTSGSNSPPSRTSAKKHFSSASGSGEPPAKRLPKKKRLSAFFSSDSDDNDRSGKDLEEFAPLESEGELQEDGDDGIHPESPAAPPRENQLQTPSGDESDNETEAESQSLLQTTKTGCARAVPHIMTSQASVQTESPGFIVELKKEAELVLIDNSGFSQLRQSPPPAELPVPNQRPPASSDQPSSNNASSPPAVSPSPPTVSPAPSAPSPSHSAAPLASLHATPVTSLAHHLVSPALSPLLPTAVSTSPSAPSAAPPVPSTVPPASPPTVYPTLLTLPSASPAVPPAPPTSSPASSRAVSPPPSTLSVPPAPPTPPSDTPGPTTLPPDPEPSVDAAEFWRNCNFAGCTQSIFSDFMSEMSSISSRIISEEASREDYDVALRVMKASGKLEEFVRKQEEELERKQKELQKVAALMQKVSLSLRR